MNKENKKNGIPARNSFNAVDVAILLLFLICAIGIYVRYERETKIASGEGDVYTVNFVCEQVRYTTVDYINVGDEVFFADSSVRLGTVTGTIVSRPSSKEISVDGRNITAYYPSDTIIDINGSIAVNGVMTENGFLIGGNTYIAPNSVLEIAGKRVDMTIRILSVIPAEQEG